jgi:DnaJ-like protein
MACLLAREHTTDVTERKPPGVSWESWFDEQIRRAREDGAFDNLPGAGKPLPDLEGGYDPDWWVKKLVQREKVSVLPAEGPPTRLGLLDPDAIVAEWRRHSTHS